MDCQLDDNTRQDHGAVREHDGSWPTCCPCQPARAAGCVPRLPGNRPAAAGLSPGATAWPVPAGRGRAGIDRGLYIGAQRPRLLPPACIRPPRRRSEVTKKAGRTGRRHHCPGGPEPRRSTVNTRWSSSPLGRPADAPNLSCGGAVTPIDVCPAVISGSYHSGPVHDHRRRDGRRFAG